MLSKRAWIYELVATTYVAILLACFFFRKNDQKERSKIFYLAHKKCNILRQTIVVLCCINFSFSENLTFSLSYNVIFLTCVPMSFLFQALFLSKEWFESNFNLKGPMFIAHPIWLKLLYFLYFAITCTIFTSIEIIFDKYVIVYTVACIL